MFGIRRIVIAQHERAIVLKDKRINSILTPGVYWFVDIFKRLNITVYNSNHLEFNHDMLNNLLTEQSELCEQYFHIVELSDHEVAYISLDGKLSAILAPASRQFYWRDARKFTVEIQNIKQDFVINEDKLSLLSHDRIFHFGVQYQKAILSVEVAQQTIALLFVDGKLLKTLAAGVYAFWQYNRKLSIKMVDLRLQSMDISGQEILTKDKVSLRINLAANYQIIDPVKAHNGVVNIIEFIYRECQFAIREAIGTEVLDDLLANKGELDAMIFKAVANTLIDFGVKIFSVGVKDIILPGDMKDILNQVVEVEKAAQANVIKRREETAATRSLLNTAKLMAQNPLLMRLKELETMEKITEKVDKLTVFGGLDGVLKEVVKIA